jgi:multiple sugar transport system substrate-binding protein
MARKTFRIAVRKFEPFESVVKKFWEGYRKVSGCDLQLEAVPMDLKLLHSSIIGAKGLKNGEWDVAQVNTDWIAEARDSGSLLNLTPYIKQKPPEDYPEGWSDSMLKIQTFGEEIVGLPFHDGPECLVYRKDLFEDPVEKKRYYEQFGQGLRVPSTWGEFVQVARFFNRPEDKLYGTLFAGYPDRHNNIFDFTIQLLSRGGELVNDKNEIVLNSSQAEEAMTFYRNILRDNTAVHPRCPEVESIESGYVFASGEVAMMVNWFGFASMCETIPESKVKGKVDVAGIPHSEGCSPVSLNVYYIWGVGSGSPHKDIAYDFIRYCVSRENDRILPIEGAIGCRKSTWEDKEINRIIPYYYRLEELHQYAREFPRLSIWHKVTEIIDDLVLEVVNTDNPIKEILNNAQIKIDKIIDKH